MTVARIIPFSYQDHEIRTIQIQNQVFFVGKDVCGSLGIKNHKDAIGRLDVDEKRGSVIPTTSGSQEMSVINESGLYHLIFKSRKPEAQAFRKWVTSEVLPTLRKTGNYQVPKAETSGSQLTLPFLDADHYLDQVKREMLEVALRVGPNSRAGKFLKLIKPLVYGAQREQI